MCRVWPAADCFTPIRGCGLKPRRAIHFKADETFHPHTGVWIETSLFVLRLVLHRVFHPHTGVWIETAPILISTWLYPEFHPHTGVWIETKRCPPIVPSTQGFTPIRGCGLKHRISGKHLYRDAFHPHTGVWIETSPCPWRVLRAEVSPPYGGVD